MTSAAASSTVPLNAGVVSFVDSLSKVTAGTEVSTVRVPVFDPSLPAGSTAVTVTV